MDEGMQLRSFVTLFQKLTECPICLDTLKIPFRQCARGHLMCSSCAEPLKCCPTCKADLSIENPIGVKNILESLPKFCCHSSYGCQAVIDSGDDHETQCGFRPETCRICRNVVSVNQLETHFTTNHAEKCFLKFTESNSIKMHITKFIPFFKRHSNVLVSAFGHLFWFEYSNNIEKTEFIATFEVISAGHLEEDYYVQVKFEEGNFIFACTLQAYKEKVKTVLKRGESDSSKQSDGNVKKCMRIPISDLDHFIDKDLNLQYQLTFFKHKQQ